MTPTPAATESEEHTQLQAVAGMAALTPSPHTWRIPFLASHPTAHGTLRIELALQGSRITSALPHLGVMHRGAEKLCEVRDYRQALALTDRHDWTSAFTSELAFALAVESLAGMQPPQRATWLRTLMSEITRVHSHLTFLSLFPHPSAPSPACFVQLREQWLDVIEALTGGRMHVMFCRIGGVACDVPSSWFAAVERTITATVDQLPSLHEYLGGDDITPWTHGVGIISPEQVRSHGLSGMVARASGVDHDLRRDQPYCAFDEVFSKDGPGRVVTAAGGDVAARLHVMTQQLLNSLDIVRYAADRLRSLPPGPINIPLPKVLKLPESATYQATEAPGGHTGFYVVSHGQKTPHRVKYRTHGFAAAGSLVDVLPGTHLEHLAPILGSLCLVMGDVDK